jgi:hypothetical protein
MSVSATVLKYIVASKTCVLKYFICLLDLPWVKVFAILWRYFGTLLVNKLGLYRKNTKTFIFGGWLESNGKWWGPGIWVATVYGKNKKRALDFWIKIRRVPFGNLLLIFSIGPRVSHKLMHLKSCTP